MRQRHGGQMLQADKDLSVADMVAVGTCKVETVQRMLLVAKEQLVGSVERLDMIPTISQPHRPVHDRSRQALEEQLLAWTPGHYLQKPVQRIALGRWRQRELAIGNHHLHRLTALAGLAQQLDARSEDD